MRGLRVLILVCATVSAMAAMWKAWAERVGVRPYPLKKKNDDKP